MVTKNKNNNDLDPIPLWYSLDPEFGIAHVFVRNLPNDKSKWIYFGDPEKCRCYHVEAFLYDPKGSKTWFEEQCRFDVDRKMCVTPFNDKDGSVLDPFRDELS